MQINLSIFYQLVNNVCFIRLKWHVIIPIKNNNQHYNHNNSTLHLIIIWLIDCMIWSSLLNVRLSSSGKDESTLITWLGNVGRRLSASVVFGELRELPSLSTCDLPWTATPPLKPRPPGGGLMWPQAHAVLSSANNFSSHVLSGPTRLCGI